MTEKDQTTTQEQAAANQILDALEGSAIAAQHEDVKRALSQLMAILLPEGLHAGAERLYTFTLYAERLRAWQVRLGHREAARKTYITLMKARRRWLVREGLASGRLGLVIRSWFYALAGLLWGYGESLSRWFVSSFVMVYIFGFIFILVDYLKVNAHQSPVFDINNSGTVGMYFYLSLIAFFDIGFRSISFDDFTGLWLIDLEFMLGKIMLMGLLAIIIRKFVKQTCA